MRLIITFLSTTDHIYDDGDGPIDCNGAEGFLLPTDIDAVVNKPALPGM